jgi:hypothetical protein
MGPVHIDRILKRWTAQPGPLNQLISDALAVIAPHVPRDLTWPILLLTAGLATTIWLFRNGAGAKGADGRVRKMPLRQFLLPTEIYTHVSARVDVGLYVFERLLRPLWVTTLLVVQRRALRH